MSSFIAERVLDSVDAWADGYWLMRETETSVNGRIDGLLVPIGFGAHCMTRPLRPARRDESGRIVLDNWTNKPCLIGVEVKISRSDFLVGLNSGQYERYAETLSGLYVATMKGVCKTREVPTGIGHLVVRPARGLFPCSCARHPKYRNVETAAGDIWRILFAYAADAHKRELELWGRVEAAKDGLGARAGHLVMGCIAKIARQVEQDVAPPATDGPV